MSTIKELARKSFEESYLGNNKQTARRNEYGDYVYPSIQDAWSGWLAAWEDLGKDNETIQKITNGDPFVKFNEKDLKFLEIINQELEKTPYTINTEDLSNQDMLQHKIPLGSLVQVRNGERLTVFGHSRNINGMPSYTLGVKEDFGKDGIKCTPMLHGYLEESLKVIRYK